MEKNAIKPVSRRNKTGQVEVDYIKMKTTLEMTHCISSASCVGFIPCTQTTRNNLNLVWNDLYIQLYEKGKRQSVCEGTGW